ncbi:isochorismate synthase [Actinomycetospora sp.]|jgi:isochorismate synthase|uniref:isochorismate synthase n=1 Tax=Actinomycetospora sp. TaxID=1872135 RepID=UPI002F419597
MSTEPGGFVFVGPQGTVRASGAATPVCAGSGEPIADAAVRALAAGGGGDLVVGAVGFDPSMHALTVPAERFWEPRPAPDDPRLAAPAYPTDRPPTAPAFVGTRWDQRAEPSAAGYAAAVSRALARIEDGAFEKVVLARSLAVTAPAPVEVATVLTRLAAQHPGAYAFAVDTTRATGPRRTMIGASPELLLSRRGRTVVSTPLAGTVPRSTDPAEDARRAAALVDSAKDRHEHALVVAQVAERLAPFCGRLDVPSAPELSATDTLWHLSSRVEGELSDPAPTALHLATALHPTAAVCGSPTAEARRALLDLEDVPRGFYTGLVGWCDDAGDGEWAVTIRCAEVSGRRAVLQAGAGIVAGSRPEAEVAETTAKFRPLLAALGLEAAP